MFRLVSRPFIGAAVWLCSCSMVLASPLADGGERGSTRDESVIRAPLSVVPQTHLEPAGERVVASGFGGCGGSADIIISGGAAMPGCVLELSINSGTAPACGVVCPNTPPNSVRTCRGVYFTSGGESPSVIAAGLAADFITNAFCEFNVSLIADGPNLLVATDVGDPPFVCLSGSGSYTGVIGGPDQCGTGANCAISFAAMGSTGDDDDGDGVADDIDADPCDPFLCSDVDGDTCDDCSVTGGPPDPTNDGPDADGDGVCDDGECPCNPDVNADGDIDVFDILLTFECVTQSQSDPACDVNCDGRVNFCDFDIVLDAFGGVFGCGEECAACCINGSACTETTQENCEAGPPYGAGGVFQGLGTTCGVQNASIFQEPGGEVFVHVIGAPVECPASGGFQRPASGCVPGQYIDAWTSNSDAMMCHRFGVTGSPPIPADFFDPGSEPFSGVVCLSGQPLGPTPYGEFVGADTLILRTDDPFDRCALPSVNPSVVPIEIVELNLHGAQPITVTFNNGTPPQQWNVRVDLSQFGSPGGTLTVHKSHCNGGTYTSVLPVQPRFTFTRVDPPSKVEVLDTGAFGIPPVVLQQNIPIPWVSDIDPNLGYLGDPCTDFHPGIQEPVASTDCDCQNNGLLDRCELDDGLPDTNANGTPDECELAACCLSSGGCMVTTGLNCAVLSGAIELPGVLCGDVNCTPPCIGDDDCDDDYACTHDACSAGACSNTPTLYGNVDNIGGVDIFDVLCVLQGFGGFFGQCARNNLDLAPCPQGDGQVDVFDILAVLDGFIGKPGCCPP